MGNNNPNLAEIIICEANLTISEDQKSSIIIMVNTLEKNKELASEIAYKVIGFLKISMHQNYANLVEIITDYQRTNEIQFTIKK